MWIHLVFAAGLFLRVRSSRARSSRIGLSLPDFLLAILEITVAPYNGTHRRADLERHGANPNGLAFTGSLSRSTSGREECLAMTVLQVFRRNLARFAFDLPLQVDFTLGAKKL